MIKKIFSLTFVLAFLGVGCYLPHPQLFCPEPIINAVNQHSCTIIVYSAIKDTNLTGFINDLKKQNKRPWIVTKDGVNPNIHWVGVLGSGGILKDNYVITVSHLFIEDFRIVAREAFVFTRFKENIRADLIIKTSLGWEHTYNDYALLKLRENLNLPGLKIAKEEIRLGEKVIHSGSVGGVPIIRFTYATYVHYFFRFGSGDKIHYSRWWNFPYITVYPGGAGDSGGILVNTKGEIASITYCGITNFSEEYVFANPVSHLWQFLKGIDMEYLGGQK